MSLSWLSVFASGPTVDPVVDDKSPLRSVGYSIASLALWVALLLGGGWAGSRLGVDVLLLLLGWGFLVAPVLVALLMKALFPGISGRLQEQLDDIGRARRARQRVR